VNLGYLMFFKDIEIEISFILLVWGLLSIVGGLSFLYFNNSFMDAVGFQFIIWGAIDALIAIFPSVIRMLRKERKEQNLNKLKNILLINSFLDLGYIMIGCLIFIGFFEINQYNGHGVGVIIQGSFLAVFDTFYALKIIRGRK
jgi:hypothetical protein